MAKSKIVLEFGTAEGTKKWNLSYPNTNATNAQVRTAMQTVVANGSVLLPVPLSAKAAYIEIVETEDFDIS